MVCAFKKLTLPLSQPAIVVEEMKFLIATIQNEIFLICRANLVDMWLPGEVEEGAKFKMPVNYQYATTRNKFLGHIQPIRTIPSSNFELLISTSPHLQIMAISLMLGNSSHLVLKGWPVLLSSFLRMWTFSGCQMPDCWWMTDTPFITPESKYPTMTSRKTNMSRSIRFYGCLGAAITRAFVR